MSSLFGGSNTPAPEAKALGLSPQRMDSHEKAKPLPWFMGTRRMALSWLGPAYKQRTQEVDDESSGGKGGGETRVVGYNYFATIAGVACLGPVDALKEIWFDDEKVWDGQINRAPGDHSADLSIDGYGEATIYWGTGGQPIDGRLDDFGHPAYRGQCYIVFPDLFFGQDKQNAPNIELVLLRKPAANGLTGSSMVTTDDANPIHCLVDLLLSQRYGLGLTAADLDLVQMSAAAAKLAAEGVAISPLITETASAHDLMISFCEYFDGFLSWREGNKLQVLLARAPSTNVSGYPIIGEFDLTAPPEFSSPSWSETYNEVNVRFSNRVQRYQDDHETSRDLANIQLNQGEPLTLEIDRSWICQRTLAQRYAYRTLQINNTPRISAKLSVIKATAAKLAVGDFIRLSWQDWDSALVLRVISIGRGEDSAQSFDLEVESRYYFAAVLDYVPDTLDEPESEEFDPEAVAFARVLEVPKALVENARPNRIYLTALAARSSALQVKLKVYASEDGDPYERLAVLRSFAFYGTLAAAYNRPGKLDKSATGMVLNLPALDTNVPSTTLRGFRRHKLLLFVEDEIMTYQTSTFLSPTQVRITNIKRAIAGTKPSAHSASTPVMIIPFKKFDTFTSKTFNLGDSIDFKLCPSTARSTLDLAAAAVYNIGLSDKSNQPLASINLTVNGNGLTPQFTPGADINFAWDICHFDRGPWFNLWDTPFEDEKLHDKIIIRDFGGTPRIVHQNNSGDRNWTLPSAALAAAFGGGYPASFQVVVKARLRGRASDSSCSFQVFNTSGGGGIFQPSLLAPSGLSNLVGASDPATIVDRNWARIAARWSLSLPATSGFDPDDAPAALDANFAVIAAARGLVFSPLVGSKDPEATTQDNLETINAAW